MKEGKRIKTKKVIKKASKEIKKKTKSIEPEKRTLNFSLVEMVVIIIIVSLIVSVFSGFLVFKNYNYFSNITSQTSINTNDKKVNEFIELYEELKDKYVEDVNGEELIDAATKGMFDYLDIYTNYLDIDTTSDLQDRLNGEYKGIGVEITNNEEGFVEIVTVFPNTPAEEAGLKTGDYIISINGESMVGKTSADVANTIKGNPNVKFITLVYRRNNKDETVKIDISKVIIPSVESKVLDGNIGYLKLTTFSNTTYDQVEKKLVDLEKKNIKSLIIDLRDNTGGYLIAARDISELFVEKGKVIYQLKYRDGRIEKVESISSNKRNYKVVVLINEGSASASEILALALKENYDATLVGKRSFGKGTVQDTSILSNGSMIKYTSAYWLSPSGKSINGVGIEPDVIVDQSKEGDTQLDKAIETIK